MSLLKTIAIVLVILWAAGFLIGNVGNFIHALIVIALIVFVVDMISGRRAV